MSIALPQDEASRQEAYRDAPGHAPAIEAERPLKIAYMMSRFPKLTETFVLREMLAVRALGMDVAVYPLRRQPAPVVHPEAEPLVDEAHFTPWFSWAVLCAHVHYLWHRPATYIQTLGVLLWANFGSLRYFLAAVAFFPKAVYLARKMAADGVTHLHAHFCSHPAAVAFVIRRLTGIPYSFTAHGTDLHCDWHMLAEKVTEADFVVAISDYNRRFIVKRCGTAVDDKIEVIHCGVDLDLFQPRRAPTAFDLGQGPFAIVCTGTLHEVKGQTYLLEACALLQQRGLDVHCHLIGEGPDRRKLVEQARHSGLQRHVTFHGALTASRVAALVGRADAAVAPSVRTAAGQREGIPVSLMEAMASGAPVVASGQSGIPELVESDVSGLLVPSRNGVALADALERLYHDKDLRTRLARAGREKVLREFDMEKNAHQLAAQFLHQAEADTKETR